MNKKRGRRAALAAALLAVMGLCVLGLCARLRETRLRTVDAAPIGQTDARDLMQIRLTADPGTRTLRGTQSLTAVNRTGEALGEAVLRLYMNGPAEGSVSVTGVRADGQEVRFALDEEDPTVLHIALDWAAGQRITLTWTLMVKHEKGSPAAVVTLPALAMWEDGAWRTDAWDELADPSYAPAFDYTLELVCPDETGVAFGGALLSGQRETGVGETLYTVQMQGARDVSFALAQGGVLRQREAGGVLVSALAGGSATAGALLGRAQEALQSLEKAGFAYPFPSLTLVETQTGREDGLALSGLCALAMEDDREALLRRLTRLVARQTFGILVESDPWNAPWLSVSLASAAELLAYRQRRGDGALETRFLSEVEPATRLTRPYGVNVGAGTAHFGGDTEMTQVLRDQGAAMLMGIAEAAGVDAFTQALTHYVQGSAGGVAGLDALVQALQDVTGSSWDGYLLDMLAV